MHNVWIPYIVWQGAYSINTVQSAWWSSLYACVGLESEVKLFGSMTPSSIRWNATASTAIFRSRNKLNEQFTSLFAQFKRASNHCMSVTKCLGVNLENWPYWMKFLLVQSTWISKSNTIDHKTTPSLFGRQYVSPITNFSERVSIYCAHLVD